MKTLLVKLTLAAVLAAPLASTAQFPTATGDRTSQLTLLRGPNLLSPATEWRQAADGRWSRVQTITPLGTPANTTTAVPGSNRLLSVGSAPVDGQFYFVSIPLLGGTLRVGTAADTAKQEKSNFIRELKTIAQPLSPGQDEFRFDSKMPQLLVPLLQKKPAAAPSGNK